MFVVVVVVVFILTRIIKSVVTEQAPVTLELRNTSGKNTHNPEVGVHDLHAQPRVAYLHAHLRIAIFLVFRLVASYTFRRGVVLSARRRPFLLCPSFFSSWLLPSSLARKRLVSFLDSDETFFFFSLLHPGDVTMTSVGGAWTGVSYFVWSRVTGLVPQWF